MPNLYEHIPLQSANPASKIGDMGNGFVPNITGTFVVAQSPNVGETDTGAFTNKKLNSQSNIYKASEVLHVNYTHTFGTSRSSAVYAVIDKVTPAFVVMNYCIKY